MKNNKNIVVVVIIVLLSFINTYSQTTPEQNFQIENIGSSFNERGYSKDNVVNMDGNLSISPYNLNAMYTYPIYNQKINGSNINIELTYSGDVSYKSLAAFDMDNNSWRQFSLNRPVWILGLNGFAVQAFSFTNLPINRPDMFSPPNNSYQDTMQFITDNYTNWLLPGYDFCGRMNSLCYDKNTTNNRNTSDEIRILRSDGSVLELINVNSTNPDKPEEFSWNSDILYTGYYYENSSNSKGYGYVTYDGTSDKIKHCYPDDAIYSNKPFIPRILRYYPGDGMEYVFKEYLAPFGGMINYVRDPSGEKLNFVPFGGTNQGNYSWGTKNNSSLLTLDATPSIFYLTEIHNQNQKVIDLTYSRQINVNQHNKDIIVNTEEYLDNTVGRASLMQIGDILKFTSYGGSVLQGLSCTFSTPTRNIKLVFDKTKINFFGIKNFSFGNDYYMSHFYDQDDATYRNANQWIYTNMEEYYTYIPYITYLEDMQITNDYTGFLQKYYFDYEQIENVFGYYFGGTNPYYRDNNQVSDFNPQARRDIITRNFFLNRIVEPTRVIAIDYQSSVMNTFHDPILNTDIKTKSCDISPLLFSSSDAVTATYNYFHTPVNKVSFFKRNPNIINAQDLIDLNNFPSDNNVDKYREDVYDFSITQNLSPDPNPDLEYGYRCSSVNSYDKLTNKSSKKEYKYRLYNLIPIKNIVSYTDIGGMNPLTFVGLTNLYETYQYNDTTETYKTYTRYGRPQIDPCKSPIVTYFVNSNHYVPLSTLKTYSKSISNSIVTADMPISYQTFEYDYKKDYLINQGKNIDDVASDLNFMQSEALLVNLEYRLDSKTIKDWVCKPSCLSNGTNDYFDFDINGTLEYGSKAFHYLQLPPLKYLGDFGSTGIIDKNIKDNKVNKKRDGKILTDPEDYFIDLIVPPIFDIENQVVTFGQSNNFLDGKASDIEERYRIDPTKIFTHDNLTRCRGKITKEYKLFDPTGSSKDLLNELSYSTNFTNNGLGFLSQIKNANGSTQDFYYCYAAYSTNPSFFKFLNTDKSITSQNIFDSEMLKYEYDYRDKPAVTVKNVNKYSTSGLQTEHLQTYQKLNVLASPMNIVNENGWLSSFYYNSYNELSRAILPFDFPSPNLNNMKVTKQMMLLTGNNTSRHWGTTSQESCEIWDDLTYHYSQSEQTNYDKTDNDLICEFKNYTTPNQDGCYHGDLDYLKDNHQGIILKGSKDDKSNEKNKSDNPLSEHAVLFKNQWTTGWNISSDVKLTINIPSSISNINSISSAVLHLPLKKVIGANALKITLTDENNNQYSGIRPIIVNVDPIVNKDGTPQNKHFTVELNTNDVMSLLNSGTLIIKIEPQSKSNLLPLNDADIEIMNGGKNVSTAYFDPIDINCEPYLDLQGEFELKLIYDVYTFKYSINNVYDDVNKNFHTQKHFKIDDKDQTNNDTWSNNDDFRYFYRSHSISYDFGYEFTQLNEKSYIDNRGLFAPISLKHYDYDGFGNKLNIFTSLYDAYGLKTDAQTQLYNDPLGRMHYQKLPDLTVGTSMVSEPLVNKHYSTVLPHNGLNELTGSQFVTFKSWFGLMDDLVYYGVCNINSTINENTSSLPFTITNEYSDAFNRHRGTIIFEQGANLNILKAIRYDYDELNRVTFVRTLKDVNLLNSEQITRYWYDNYGRIKYKYQPDMGIQTFAYDKVGNLRFTQNSNQVSNGNENDRLTFYEYDDLNRIQIVGEAIIDSSSYILTGNKITDVSSDLENNNLNLNWLTDLSEDYLKLNHLNNNASSQDNNLTANYTLFQTPDNSKLPVQYVNVSDFWPNVNCIPLLYQRLNNMLNNEYKPKPPLIQHPAYFYEPMNIASGISSFENIAANPQNILRAYFYDELPSSLGGIWGHFPLANVWNAMCPSGTVENLKGKISAIAYREHNGQPYNFMVFSYDARGRTSAILGFTDNVGFDAIYYTYNSSNEILTVKVADEVKSMTYWYDYDDFGRLAKIWTTNPNSDLSTIPGLCGNVSSWNNSAPSYASLPVVLKPSQPDVVYNYYQNNLLLSKTINNGTTDFISTTYSYNPRLWLSNISAAETKLPLTPTVLFNQNISYVEPNNKDRSYPRISNIHLDMKHLTSIILEYNYDNLNQLISDHSSYGFMPRNYEYDNLGNRTKYILGVTSPLLTPPYYQTDYNYLDASHPNRLTDYHLAFHPDQNNIRDDFFGNFIYYNNGAIKSCDNDILLQNSPTSFLWQRKQEFYDYDIFGLMNRYYTASEYSAARNCSEADIPYCYRTEWRYKYNPFNEREQKRLYYSFNGDANGSLYPWVYYLLGFNNEQYTTYNGLQIGDPTFAIGPSEVCTNPYPQIVFMYPEEYNVFGNDNKADMTYRLNNSGTWSKDVMCYDHLGNVLMSLRANTSTNSFDITSENYYRAYGQKIDVISPVTHDRLGFINKEKDVENDLGDFGVRKYDESIGRFTSTDKLFEKYAGWTPYQYSMNNPVNMLDGNGKQAGISRFMNQQEMEGASKIFQDKRTWYGMAIVAGIFTGGAALEGMITAETISAGITSTAGFMSSTTSVIVNTTKLAAPDNKDVQKLRDNPLATAGDIVDQITSNKNGTYGNVGDILWNSGSLVDDIINIPKVATAIDAAATATDAVVNTVGLISAVGSTTAVDDGNKTTYIYPIPKASNPAGNSYYQYYPSVQPSNYLNSTLTVKP